MYEWKFVWNENRKRIMFLVEQKQRSVDHQGIKQILDIEFPQSIYWNKPTIVEIRIKPFQKSNDCVVLALQFWGLTVLLTIWFGLA